MSAMRASASLQFVIIFLMAVFSADFCQAIDNLTGGICNNKNHNSTVCQGVKGPKISNVSMAGSSTSPRTSSSSTPSTKSPSSIPATRSPTRGGTAKTPPSSNDGSDDSSATMSTMTAPASPQFIIIFLMAVLSIIFCQAIGGICNNGTDNSIVCRGTEALKISHIVEEPIVEVEPISSPGQSSSSTPVTKSPAIGGITKSTTISTAGSSSSMASPFIVARPSLQALALVITVTSFLFFFFDA